MSSLSQDDRLLKELEAQEQSLIQRSKRRLPGLEGVSSQEQPSGHEPRAFESKPTDRGLRRQATFDYEGPSERPYPPSSLPIPLPSEYEDYRPRDDIDDTLSLEGLRIRREMEELELEEEEAEKIKELKRVLSRKLPPQHQAPPTVVDDERVRYGRTGEYGVPGYGVAHSAPSSSLPLSELMKKLEQDNKILEELDRKIYDKGHSTSLINLYGQQMGQPQIEYGHLQSILDHPLFSAYRRPHSAFPTTTAQPHLIQQQQAPPPLIFLPLNNLIQTTTDTRHHRTKPHPPPPVVSEAKALVDSIEVPNRGRARVFIAKYSYDPFRQSPNENPESELSLAAGDFILVFGEVDSDGFYFGELLDGRRGLVPSNFVQQLTGEDLFDFQASVLYLPKDQAPPPTVKDAILDREQAIKSRLQAVDDLALQHQQKTIAGGLGVTDVSDLEFPAEFYDAILDDAIGHTSFQHLLAPEDFHRMNDYVELAEAEEHVMDEDDLYPDLERAQAVAARDPVPPPKRLMVERQLHKSLLLSWLHPDAPRGFIDSFHVYVDGVLKISVPAGERTKALIEGVESAMAHRISVRAVTPNGRMSKDAACTVVIGRNVPFAPCCVKSTNITSESALISWLPCNSNFYHVVAVNSVEVKTVNPSTYKHLITGLAANTLYRVSVRAKPGKLFLSNDEKNPKKLQLLTTFVDFRTLPKSLPEPPVDVQIESGPQEGTLLVTWLPVTVDAYGQSNQCPVTGYAVFAAHKKLAEIDSPTGDHCLLDVIQVESFHKKAVTVRTKSGENLSQDSIPCPIPDDLLKLPTADPTTGSTQFIHRRREAHQRAHHPHQSPHHHPHPAAHVRPASQGPFGPHHLPMIDVTRAGAGTVVDPVTGMVRPASAPFPGQGILRPGQQMIQRPGQLPMTQMMMGPGGQGMMTGVPGQQIGMMGMGGMQAPFGTGGMMGQQLPGQQGMFPGGMPGQQGMLPAGQPGMMGQTGLMGQPPGMMAQTGMMMQPGGMIGQQGLMGHTGGVMGMQPQQQQQSTGLMGKMMQSLLPGQTQQQQQQQLMQQQQQAMMMQQQRMTGPGGMMGVGGIRQPGMMGTGMLGAQQLGMLGQQQTGMMGTTIGLTNPTTGQMGMMGTGQRFPGAMSTVPQPGVRWFVALYDYDPLTMSPNPDGADEELGFREGDLIKVYGDKDADGFYRGEATDGRSGFVPCNMVSEVSGPEAVTVTSDGHTVPAGSRKMIALYDYDPQENSPNPDADVSNNLPGHHFAKFACFIYIAWVDVSYYI